MTHETHSGPAPTYCLLLLWLSYITDTLALMPDSLAILSFFMILVPLPEVPLSETVEPPGIAIAAAPSDEDVGNEMETRYTLATFDPDAPSAANPTSSQFRHWVITGLTPTDDPTAPALQPTPAANAYRPQGPPNGSGIH
ncbi:hypothetical protein B0H13DRAFT_2316800 [Mycena leptocephala]|nr:hypothetical protein B0H13DRAFT_2316800 [Mycena leptocephala]